MSNGDKIILHLCADIGSDSIVYKEHGYDVRCIGSDIGVENYNPPENVYGIIANPPCTQFSLAKTTGSPRDMHEGMRLVKSCLKIIWECQYDLEGKYSKKTKLKFWCMENPNGLLKYMLGVPVYTYSPDEFGDTYQKNTCLWGWFNKPIKTHSKKNLLGFGRMKSKNIHPEYFGKLTRQERRSVCSQKFAQAFYEVNQ